MITSITQTTRKAATVTAAVLAALLLALTGAAMLFAGAETSPTSAPTALFTAADGITLQADVAGTSLTDGSGTPLFAAEDKRGVQLTGTAPGASVRLDKTFSGAFEMDFRVWSDQTLDTADGWQNFKDYRGYDLRELKITFDDGTDKIHLYIAGGDEWKAVLPTARVQLNDGDRLAIQYDDATGALRSYRANSYGSWIFGSSFVNLGRGFKTWLQPGQTISSRIGFDPAAMQVYCYGYTPDNSAVTKYVVWDFTNALTVGNFSGPAPTQPISTLDSFGDYTVTVAFSDIETDKTAKAVVYSVCGQSLAGTDSFAFDNGPAVSLTELPLGRVGEEIELSVGVAGIEDFFEGSIDRFDGTVTVTRPSGGTDTVEATDGGYLYTPTEEGNHTVTYVARDAAGNAGEPSSAELRVLHELLTDGIAIPSLFTADSSGSMTTDFAAPSYMTPANGLKLTAETAGTTFTYKNKLKLKKNVPFIKMGALTSRYGQRDYDRILLTLTDAADPTNVMRIAVTQGLWGNEYSYYRASAGNMRMGGYNFDNKEIQYVETQGFVGLHSFTGESRGVSAVLTELTFDNDTRRLTVRPTPHEENCIIDFDDPKHYGSYDPWYGFTDGEFYLSITLTMFTSSRPAELLVTELNGQALDGNFLYDDHAPSIGVDYAGYAKEDLPQAEANAAYPLFAYTAYDEAEGDLTDNVAVAAYYGDDPTDTLPVTDGKITPTKAGTVTVTYAVADERNNRSEERYTVTVAETLPAQTVRFAGDVPSAMYVGETLRLPAYTTAGGSGRNTAEITLQKDGDPAEFDGATVRPTAAGAYVIRVRLTDYIGQETTVEFPISVTVSPKPILTVADFPPAFIRGCSYTLPAAQAIDWASAAEPVQVPVSVTACYAGEQPVPVTGKFTADTVGTVTFTYTAAARDDATAVTEVTVTRKVLSGIGIAGLFDTDGVSIHAFADGGIFYAYGDGSATLAGSVLADAFSMRLNLYTAGSVRYDAFRSFTVTLTECGDSENAVSLRLGPADLESEYTITAAAFRALAGKRAYVRLSFEGVSDTSAVLVKQLCNQPFGGSPYDIIRPVIVVNGDVPTEVGYGKIFTVPAADCFDVFDPTAVLGVSITAPDGTTICENARIDQPIRLLADHYGYFSIEYVARDHNGNRLLLSYAVKVKDAVPPVIRLGGTVAETASRGSTVTLPAATAADNLTENIKVYVFVTAPDGTMFAADGSFTAGQAGKYTVWYYAIDEEMNSARLSFTVTVA